LDAEDVGDGALEVVAVQPGDKHFAFLVEDEDAADHSERRMGGRGWGMVMVAVVTDNVVGRIGGSVGNLGREIWANTSRTLKLQRFTNYCVVLSPHPFCSKPD